MTDLAGLVSLLKREPRGYTLAHTFPTSAHAMWLYYRLASAGVNPLSDVKCIVVPAPQMVSNMDAGNMDEFSAREPWNHRAILKGAGISAATSQDVWMDHPENVLGTRADFVKQNPNTARAVTIASLEASRWIDASLQNKMKMAETMAQKPYINASVGAIYQRLWPAT